MKRLPPAVARRIRSRREYVPESRAAIYFGVVAAASNAGLLAVAVYAAFFSPFSQAVEGQLRGEVAEKSVEKVRLENALVTLERAFQDGETALEKQSEELSQKTSQLENVESDRQAALINLQRLRAEAARLQATLRYQYREKYVSSLPTLWGEGRIPEVYVDALNEVLGSGGTVTVTRIAKEVYLSSMEALSVEGDSELERQVSRELRELVVSRCRDAEKFVVQFVAQVDSVDGLDAVGRARLIGDAARDFVERCLST